MHVTYFTGRTTSNTLWQLYIYTHTQQLFSTVECTVLVCSIYQQMVNLYRDPVGEKIFSDSALTSTKQSTHPNHLTMTTRVFDQMDIENVNSNVN